MDKKNYSSACISIVNPASRHSIVMLIAISASLFGIGLCQGQNIPFSDLVPLEDLEVKSNELIQIATSYSDGQRDLKIAQLNLETLTVMSSSTVVSQLEMKIAKLNVATAERKATIYRAIAEKQLTAAKAKLEILEQMEKVGQNGEKTATPLPISQNRIRIAQARAMVNILQMILEPLPK